MSPTLTAFVLPVSSRHSFTREARLAVPTSASVLPAVLRSERSHRPSWRRATVVSKLDTGRPAYHGQLAVHGDAVRADLDEDRLLEPDPFVTGCRDDFLVVIA